MDEAELPPYTGLRVLDLAQGFAGPYCAALLGMQGADVIKVEPPRGDWIREIGGSVDGITAWTIIANAGKRSAAIDARQPQGRVLLQRLAAGVDVIVQNFRPGVIERMGLGYDALRVANPGLIFVSVTGFGSSGPEAARAGSDSVFQAYTGIAHRNRDDQDMPRRIPILLPDTVTGLYAAQAVGSALFARSRHGKGRHIRISLLEACAAFQAPSILDDALAGNEERPPSTVPSGIFQSRDGFLTVTSMSDAMFNALLATAGLDEWIGDPRCANIGQRQKHADAINDALANKLLERTTAEWLAAFTAADVLCSEALDYNRFRAMPQTQAIGAFSDITQTPYGSVPMARLPGGAPDWPLRPCPHTGEHTRQVLSEMGIDDEEFNRLVAAGTVVQRPATDPHSKHKESFT